MKNKNNLSENSNILISNPKRLQKVKEKFIQDGLKKIHILADFEKTLTKARVDGRETSLISVLRDGDYLNADYRKQAHTLYKHYRPIEKDLKISKQNRRSAMLEWWTKHFKLLIDSGLSKKDIQSVVSESGTQFRENTLEFIDLLHNNKIPLVIMSAGGLGEAIPMLLKQEKRLYENVYIIANSFKWDKSGKAIDYKLPIIHAANKDETLIRDFPEINKAVQGRQNVILLGDGLGDVGMVDGFDYRNLIKIGFLNDDSTEARESFQKHFDIVLTSDISMEYPHNLIREIT
ncbi:hypothetical protein ACFL14_00130 [Patescibacteria group bacterium]